MVSTVDVMEGLYKLRVPAANLVSKASNVIRLASVPILSQIVKIKTEDRVLSLQGLCLHLH